jgi:K+-transporting ATPase KdpF subunit
MNTILLIAGKPVEASSSAGYVIGTLIALLIFAYLIYSLVKPEKF